MKKRSNKIYLCKYSETYFKKLPYPPAVQVQPPQAANVLGFAHTNSETEALKYVSSSLSSLPRGHADLSLTL